MMDRRLLRQLDTAAETYLRAAISLINANLLLARLGKKMETGENRATNHKQGTYGN